MLQDLEDSCRGTLVCIQRLSPEQRKGSSFIYVVQVVGLSNGMKLVGGQMSL